MREKPKKLVAFLVVLLFLISSCSIKTHIKPYYMEQPAIEAKGEGKEIILYVTGSSGRDFARLCAPAGNCTRAENSDDIRDVVAETVKNVLVDKGHKVSVTNSMPTGGKEYAFLVDVRNMDVKWQSGLFHSEAELYMQINNRLVSPSGENLLDYTFEKRGKEGGLFGNCCAFAAGFSLVGLIPFLVYIGVVGDEATQLTHAGNRYLKEYAEDLISRVNTF